MNKKLFSSIFIFLFTFFALAENVMLEKLAPISSFKNNLENGSLIISKILDREGIMPNVTHSYFDMIDASIRLFQFVLSDNDPRIRIVSHYLSMSTKIKEGLPFENALLSHYLSDFPSMRSRYAKYFDDHSITQLVRALKNLEIGEQFINYEENEGDYKFLFKRTNKITRGTDGFGVTGCPEAVWQFQLFKKKKYLGRIGLNFHIENGSIIVSIVNIQGANHSKKDSKKELDVFKNIYGNTFNVILIRKIRGKIVNTFANRDVIFRGGYYINREDVPHAMYRMTFRKEGIPVFKTGKEVILFERHEGINISS